MAQTGRIILITGGNQGVGYETAKNLILASADYHVILGSRDAAKGETAAAALQSTPGVKGTAASVQLDVTDQASIEQAIIRIEKEWGRLDGLVNNAGIISMSNPPSVSMASHPSAATLRGVLETNVVGSLAMTEAALPLLKRGGGSKGPARLVFVSSSVGSLTHATNPASPLYHPNATEYRVSKAALNMLLAMYAIRLKPEGILVFGADPGLCATNFTGDPASLRDRGAADPSAGGDRVAIVVKGEKDADAGKVHGATGINPW